MHFELFEKAPISDVPNGPATAPIGSGAEHSRCHDMCTTGGARRRGSEHCPQVLGWLAFPPLEGQFLADPPARTWHPR